MRNREKATKIMLDLIEDLYPNTDNRDMTERFLKGLSNEAFGQYMEDLRSGKEIVTVTVPNFSKTKFDEAHFLDFGKRHNISFFHHLKVTDPDTGRVFTTPLRYLLIRDRVNRLQQMLEDKTSFPLDNNHVDELSGQVTNESKGARLSFPETNNLNAKGFRAFIAEALGVRGGNAKALRVFEDQLRQHGEASISAALALSDGSKANHTLSAYLRAMLFSTTLDRGQR